GEHVSFFNVPELLASNQRFGGTALTGVPSRHFRYAIQVPPGRHSYRFYKDGTDQRASVRVFYEAHPKPQWADIAPLDALDNVVLKYTKSGKERSYVKLMKHEAFRFAVTDTTRLRILLRPEFTYRMLEATILKVKLTNTLTMEETVFKVDARRSKSLEFVGQADKVPGTLNTIYLNLPPSEAPAMYELSLVGGTKAVAVRLSNDVKLTPNPVP
ncbi:MAG: hypothetical protein AAGB22_09920, partial [Bacteroidota bacterium]